MVREGEGGVHGQSRGWGRRGVQSRGRGGWGLQTRWGKALIKNQRRAVRWRAGQGQAQEKEKEKEAAKEPEALKPDELDAEIAEMAIEEP